MENSTLNDIYKAIIGIGVDIREMKADIRMLDIKIDNVEKNLNERIDNVEKNINERIDNVEKNLNEKIDNVEKDLKQYIRKEIKETEDATCMYLEDNFVRKECV